MLRMIALGLLLVLPSVGMAKPRRHKSARASHKRSSHKRARAPRSSQTPPATRAELPAPRTQMVAQASDDEVPGRPMAR